MVITEPGKKALVEFVSSKKNDIIADQFCYLLSNIFIDPFSQTSITSEKPEDPARLLLLAIIKKDYPESFIKSDLLLVYKGDDHLATINLEKRRTDCQD